MELVGAVPKPAVDRRPDQRGCVAAVKGVDGDDSGRRRDVYFRQPLAADDVDADEEKPALFKFRPKRGADLLLARRKLGLRALAADREIGADFTLARDAVHSPSRLAVDKDDALVALRDLGDEFLDDMRLAVSAVEQLHQRGE